MIGKFFPKLRKSTCEDFAAPVAHDSWNLDNHAANVRATYGAIANHFQYYVRLIEAVSEIPNIRIVPLGDLFTSDGEDKRPRIALRHDIDADPVTGLRCARYLARCGIAGSFYLLHTASYYGMFYGQQFVRNPHLREWVEGFIVSGCEIGIHNDALKVYLDHDLDGIAALREELTWLRAVGAIVRGTVAHNSGPIYGAENFEIFRECMLWKRPLLDASGRRVPLGDADFASLDLTYEGAYPLPVPRFDQEKAEAFFSDKESSTVFSESWMRTYLHDNPACRWRADPQFWLIGRDHWVVSGPKSGLFEWQVGLERVLGHLRSLPESGRAVLLIHPEYVSNG